MKKPRYQDQERSSWVISSKESRKIGKRGKPKKKKGKKQSKKGR